MTLDTVGSAERLLLMGLLQASVVWIVAIQAQRWWTLGQVKIEFHFSPFTSLVRLVACLASHIQRYVPAAFFRDIHSRRVTRQTQILFWGSRSRLQQLKSIVCGMWIMAFQAIAHRRLVHRSLYFRSVFVRMACQAQTVRCGGNQFYAGDVLINPDFVATCASGRNRGVYRFAFRLVGVALQALCRVSVLFQGNGMYISQNRGGYQQQKSGHY